MSHKRLALSSRPLLRPTCGGSLPLEFFDPPVERRAPIIRISLKRPGEAQQGREFSTQRPWIFVRMFRHSHTVP